jgi:hypothetical protein
MVVFCEHPCRFRVAVRLLWQQPHRSEARHDAKLAAERLLVATLEGRSFDRRRIALLRMTDREGQPSHPIVVAPPPALQLLAPDPRDNSLADGPLAGSSA